jgi:hypothetical protein
MINTNVKCLLSLVAGAGLGYYAARTILERNYTVSVSNAFHDARGYHGPGYKKRVTITVKGEISEMAEYPTEAAAEPDAPVEAATPSPVEAEMFADRQIVSAVDMITSPTAKQAMVNYQGLDLNPVAREQHVREDFLEELHRKMDGVPEDEEDGYGASPLSGGSGTIVYNPPFRISEEAYGEGVDGYNSLMVIYYEGDGVLVDHNGQAMVRQVAEETIGDLTAIPFGIESHDGDICYIRCPQLKSDFEVQRCEGRFADVPSSGGNG